MRQRCLGEHQHIHLVGNPGGRFQENPVMPRPIARHQRLVGVGAQHRLDCDVAPLRCAMLLT